MVHDPLVVPPNRTLENGRLVLPSPQSPMWSSYDLIVVGGGINGTGIAREATSRGLRVLLLEKNDFGAGTSAYSSRLIHGGLRYLANLELDLVYESLQERELLLQNAPHLVSPLAMGLPLYKHSRHPRWMIGLGMLLYDLLSWGKRMPSHRMLNRTEFLQQYPGVQAEGLQGGPVYYDAQVALPERICVENAIAAQESGLATILNHAALTNILLNEGAVSGVMFTDTLSGQSYTASSPIVVNASGPWVDEILNHSLEFAPSKSTPDNPAKSRLIGGTQGSHIVVKAFPGAPSTALYVEARSDGRPFFIIPWREDYYLIGTTDLPYTGSPDDATASSEEIAYLLAETNHVLPGAHLNEADVLYSYSGVRPLPYAQGKKAGKITRKHGIADHARTSAKGLISIVGGKLTTYRNLAQIAVDYLVQAYKLSLADGKPVLPSATRNQALPGGEGIKDWRRYQQQYAQPASQEYGVPLQTAQRIISLYGSRYSRVLGLLAENPQWGEPLCAGKPEIAAQVIYAVRHEMACTLEDVLLRRLGIGLNQDIGLNAVECVSRLMAETLGWSEAQRQAEIERYRALIERHYRAGLPKEKGLSPHVSY